MCCCIIGIEIEFMTQNRENVKINSESCQLTRKDNKMGTLDNQVPLGLLACELQFVIEPPTRTLVQRLTNKNLGG